MKKELIRKKVKEVLPDSMIRIIREKQMISKHPDMISYFQKNSIFRNRFEGKRCFILGNGPSLSKINFNLLSNEYTFTVNQLSRNPNFPLLKSNFHVWADERFFDIDIQREEDLELLQIMKNVGKGNPSTIVFYKYAAKDMIEKYELDKELNIYYYGEYYSKLEKAIKSFINITHIIPAFSTVVHYCICMAVYMGFTEIYLLGCDCTGIINTIQSKANILDNLVYAYDVDKVELRRMNRSNNVNSIQVELRSYAKIFDDYATLKKYCDNNNVGLFNATPGGILDVLPRVDFYSLFEK